MVSLGPLNRCERSGNTLKDLSYKIYIPNKPENVNLKFFNSITGMNEWKH